MAKCERREIKPEPPPVEYVLTLSADEAKALRWATHGYSPTGDAKGVTAVHDALLRAGVEEWRPCV